MGEYEDRYPDAYGHGETAEKAGTPRTTELGLPRQTRDELPPAEGPPAPAPEPRLEWPARPVVERPPQDIRDDVVKQLTESPFLDASGITVGVEGSEVMLQGTIDSQMGISIARALCSNVPGVRSVQVRVHVQRTPRGIEGSAVPPAR